MNDENKVLHLGNLYYDSNRLLNNVVNTTGAEILDKLLKSIDNLTENYHGKDAEVQINTLVELYNEMIEIENDVALIAVGLTKISRNYRNVQLSFGVKKDEMTVAKYEKQRKLDEIMDKRDTVDISEDVLEVRSNMDSIRTLMEDYNDELNDIRQKICENWLLGKGHDKMEELFYKATTKVELYKEKLIKGTSSVKQAINNYEF